jgi:hypothetical protein
MHQARYRAIDTHLEGGRSCTLAKARGQLFGHSKIPSQRPALVDESRMTFARIVGSPPNPAPSYGEGLDVRSGRVPTTANRCRQCAAVEPALNDDALLTAQ